MLITQNYLVNNFVCLIFKVINQKNVTYNKCMYIGLLVLYIISLLFLLFYEN